MAHIQKKDSVEKIRNEVVGKGGRPKALEGKKKNKSVTSYFTENEHAALNKFLKDNPHTISSFMRECTLEKMNIERSKETKNKKEKKRSKKKSKK